MTDTAAGTAAPAPYPGAVPSSGAASTGGGAATATVPRPATPYDEIAGTRPRIRRDVLFTRTPDGVHFHNARGGFSVVMPSAYRFASLIVPHLTGEVTVAALCQGLGEKQRDMVARLVRALYARGFARDAVPPAEDAPVPEPAVARRFAPQIAYADHYADDAAARFLRFRATRVAVLGDDRTARWAALSLLRNGCASVAVAAAMDAPGNGFAELGVEAEQLRADGCPVTVETLPARQTPYTWAELADRDLVVVTGADGPSQTAALAAAVPPGRKVLPVWMFGRSAVAGPLLAHGTAGCWTCAALRLGANGDPAHAADLWSTLAPAGPRATPAALSGPVAAMLGNLLAYEVFRIATGALPAETAGQLIVQDTDSLDTVAEPLLPHPRCPSCSGLAAPTPPEDTAVEAEGGPDDIGSTGTTGTTGSTGATDLQDTSGASGALGALDAADAEPPATVLASLPEDRPGPAGGPAAAAGDADAAEQALAELTTRAVLVRPMAGVFSGYADERWAQTPLKAGSVTLGLGHGVRRTVSAFDVHHVAGARLRALRRAAEVYTDHVVPVAGALTGPDLAAARADRPAVDPADLGTASGLGADADTVAVWAPAVSLLGGGTVLVPAAALRPFGPDNAERVVEPTAAGIGAGRSPREAAARGLLTALGYEALRAALHGAAAVRPIASEAVGSAGDPELTFLVRSATTLGAEVELLDLGTPEERAVPAVLARAGGRWALGTALSWRDAALEALRDLLGAVQLAAEPDAPAPLDIGDPLLRDLDPAALATSGTAAAPDLAEATAWPTVAERLRAAGRDVLAAPALAPDLAAGRLYTTRIVLTSGPADGR
ncbi:TOMM precursor leader peptide-binding protein [Actinacidiphila yeochonensis]|uniref:TOMM precursor leader peptide-binding protein n=1 Tax=Actinacidiphila yeochonensis TaxID=89050 RepID=UPI00068B5799|nr:TOMM precursor leader peptide-binding protein [Actinacidiphila yeochonensis]